jgi:hypothetical protein
MRTVRIPEDGKNYDLPPNLGKFPLLNVQAFRHKLPPSMSALGGLFLPMYRELFFVMSVHRTRLVTQNPRDGGHVDQIRLSGGPSSGCQTISRWR